MTGTHMIPVTIKWSKQTFSDIQIDTTEPATVFKSQLWTLTGVPPERQTVLGLKGGKLKDDTEWSATDLKPGKKLILMGTPDSKLPPSQKNLPAVRDDLDVDAPEAEDIVVGPPGLVNLGNTCYMNATVQCLAAVPPLGKALREFSGSSMALNPAEKLATSLRDVFSRLRSRNSSSVNPMGFLSVLRTVNPQFAERGQTGMFMQQDAEECWGAILTRLASALTTGSGSVDGNVVDQLFGFRMKGEDKCVESEEMVERAERVRALKCHISVHVNHLPDGVREGLEETIEKRSDQLGRSVEWRRENRMDSLPPFLLVQFVRFFWKATEGVKAKILRNVSFPLVLDVYDFCTEELKGKLGKKRDEMRAKREEMTDVKEEVIDVSGAAATEEIVDAQTGNYELFAVLTHQGRAADSGHYVAWVKETGGRGQWMKFDDDKVTMHGEEEVKKLSGGGAWHMAYMCLYRAREDL